MTRLTLSAVFLLCFGCTHTELLEEQWLGRDKSVLISLKGSPDKIMSDGFGGRIYSYGTYSTFYDSCGPYCGPYYGPYGYRHGYGYWDYYHDAYRVAKTGEPLFWIDPLAKIYRVSVKR